MQYQVITTQEQLNMFVNSISGANILALDTEFMRRKTLYPEVALIQVYDGQHLALIDPLISLDFSDFWSLLQDEKILKVLHSPSEDIEVFLQFAGFVPRPMFDTQFALQLLGEGNCVGFANMVKSLLDVEIDKSESRTNWLQRPLTSKQLDYAASDVFYLFPCYEIISQQIIDKGWFDFVIQEVELISQKRAFRVPDEHIYKDVKNAWQLKPHELVVLRELAAWRVNKAIRKNLALNFVLKEQNMFEIARQQPTSLTSLKRVPNIERMEVQRSGKEIIACVEAGKQVSKESHPDKLLRLIDYPTYKKEAKVVLQLIKQVALKHDLPADVIASKKQVNQLLSWNWKLDEEGRKEMQKPDLLSSWRYLLVKEALKDWDC